MTLFLIAGFAIGFVFGILIGRISQALRDAEHPEEFLRALGYSDGEIRALLTFRRRKANA